MKVNIDKETIKLIEKELDNRYQKLPYSQKDWDDLIEEIVNVGLNLYLEML
jgi:hypothetical protein